MAIRAIRGAVQLRQDDLAEMREAVVELLSEVLARNGLTTDDLVSILFIIFDLEVAFLFPWAISLKSIGMFGFWSMVAFLAVLTIGFIYEWKKGALEWE